MRTYGYRTEAIQADIIEVIEATGAVEDAHAEFDIDAIADTLIIEVPIGTNTEYQVDEDADFWAIVEAHAN